MDAGVDGNRAGGGPGRGSAFRRRLALFAVRSRYVWRVLLFLRPYAGLVTGAYAAVFGAIVTSLAMPGVIRGIVDEGIRQGASERIASGCVLLLLLALVGGVCTFLSGRWTEMASQNVAFDIRNRFHAKLQALSFSFHDAAETGQLLTRSVSDVDRIRFLTGRAFLHLVQMLTMILGACVAMVVMNRTLGLLVWVTVPFLLVGALVLGAKLRPLSMAIRDREGILTSRLEQNLRGARIVKTFGREEAEIARFGGDNLDLLALQRREAGLRAVYLPLMHLLTSLATLVVLLAGGLLVIRGSLTLGELVAFLAYVALLAVPGRRFGWVVAAIAQASASAERIFEVLDLHSDIVDSPDAMPVAGVRGAIRFENVSFGYSRGHPILKGISFAVLPGEKVALLGATGSGKSTVVNLVPRFYDPTEGVVRLDGIDLRRITVKSLRSHIGVVLQDTVLFAASVRENIAFGRPDAAEAEIVAAAQAAHAHGFITGLPKGYDTNVGEKGLTLSGGQRQRLAIARAILMDPEILILDDATSSVDTETEALIQEALRKLMRNRTALIIAQRLSTVREADRVLVLESGRIAAMAVRTPTETPHEQLLRSSGLYADICSRQLRGDAAGGDRASGGVP
ncbi:MAG: ABC transporter ATP-binding protein [Lentisphaeria bacterium]|nr:ABC transporter ATP-binding protein [Lentisphaeria bacterium]